MYCKIAWISLLSALALSGWAQDSVMIEDLTWNKIFSYKSVVYRTNYLHKYIRVRTGDSARMSTCMHKEDCINIFLNLNAENVALFEDFVHIPEFLFADTLKMVYLQYSNYCKVAKSIGDRVFQAMPTRKYHYKHIVLVLKAAGKEKEFYVDMEEKKGRARIRTADFLTNKHELIRWDESRFMYPDEEDPFFNPYAKGKKSFSVGDRISLVGHLFHPTNFIQITAPVNNAEGAVFYRFYLPGYENVSPTGKLTMKTNLPNAIIPYVFVDSSVYYPYFVLEFANDADSVLDHVVKKTAGGGYKHLTTQQFLDFILPGLIRANAHSIIEYHKRKTLFIEFIPADDPYWNYDTERIYDDRLAIFLYDAKLKEQTEVRHIFVRFNHSDGSKNEFAHNLNDPVYKDIYKVQYFMPAVIKSMKIPSHQVK